MYSSDTSIPRGKQSHLTDSDIDLAIAYISASQPAKVTISGGGEPMLQKRHVTRLIEAAQAPCVELITAAQWARSPLRAKEIIADLSAAREANTHLRTFLLRASIDRFHLTAPNAVPLMAYVNLVRVWQANPNGIELGLRSLLLEHDDSVEQLASALSANLLPVDSWNQLLQLNDGTSVPVTRNVLRFTGKGSHFASLRAKTLSMRDYYEPFEESPRKLLLASAINDAIHRRYSPAVGLSITLDYDGSLLIFTGSAPDRRANIRTHSFEESIDWFYADPITRVLLQEGVYWLFDAVEMIDPAHVRATLENNDICAAVDRLLDTPILRAFVTAAALKDLLDKGQVLNENDFPLLGQLAAAPIQLLAAQVQAHYERRT